MPAGVPELSEPSEWWWTLRNGPGGEETLRSLLRQTLQALHTLHTHNITHRRALQSCPSMPCHIMDMVRHACLVNLLLGHFSHSTDLLQPFYACSSPLL